MASRSLAIDFTPLPMGVKITCDGLPPPPMGVKITRD
jgi:hypothetical protein